MKAKEEAVRDTLGRTRRDECLGSIRNKCQEGKNDLVNSKFLIREGTRMASAFGDKGMSGQNEHSSAECSRGRPLGTRVH